MIRDPYAVIKMPLLSEKSDKMKDGLNKIVLIVDRKANKVDVRHAIEKLFKVKVEDVNIINVRGKVKRLGARTGKRPDWKKAIATLAPGQKVEFIEGV